MRLELAGHLAREFFVAPVDGLLELLEVVAPGDRLAVDAVVGLGLGGDFRQSKERVTNISLTFDYHGN